MKLLPLGARVRTSLQWLTGVSSWRVLFEHWHPDKDRHIACFLEDGSWVQGKLVSWNDTGAESADRDLVLGHPIKFRSPGATDDPKPLECGAVCISARRIVSMFVSYTPKAGP